MFDRVERPEPAMTTVTPRRGGGGGKGTSAGKSDGSGADVGTTETRGLVVVNGCSVVELSSSENGSSAFKIVLEVKMLLAGGREDLGGGGSSCGKGLAEKEDGDFAEIILVRLFKFSSSSASSLALGTISDRNSISSGDKASDCDRD